VSGPPEPTVGRLPKREAPFRLPVYIPSRRRILDLLRQDERSVGDLVERLGMSQPGVSKQLRVLREAGLVRVRAFWSGRKSGVTDATAAQETLSRGPEGSRG
jgi:DNA-binding transcriptional ArsR family regulator